MQMGASELQGVRLQREMHGTDRHELPTPHGLPFYDNSAKFKPTAEQQAEKKRKRAKIRDGLTTLKYTVKGTKACRECPHRETCTTLSYGCLLINLALNELEANK